MAIVKTREQREIELLNKVEKDIERSKKREKVHYLIMGGLCLLTVGAFMAGASIDRRFTAWIRR